MAETTRDGDVLDLGSDGALRCWWGAEPEEYRAYHDHEWGRPVTDDVRLFEKLCLEGFQSGLSWLTILRKRESFRRAFAGFDPRVVAEFGDQDVARLLEDAGIVRHRGKIVATITNARRALDLVDECGSLSDFVWSFAPGDRRPAVTRSWLTEHPTSTESVALSRELKRRGWAFVGPTTVYAFMQAMGLVNDHQQGCDFRADAEAARTALVTRRDLAP